MKITRTQLRKLIKEEISSDAESIQVPGLGTMERGQIISSITDKLQDMSERNTNGNHDTLGDSQLNVLIAMWKAVSNTGE